MSSSKHRSDSATSLRESLQQLPTALGLKTKLDSMPLTASHSMVSAVPCSLIFVPHVICSVSTQARRIFFQFPKHTMLLLATGLLYGVPFSPLIVWLIEILVFPLQFRWTATGKLSVTSLTNTKVLRALQTSSYDHCYTCHLVFSHVVIWLMSISSRK